MVRKDDNSWEVAQLPEVEGALVALDPRDGAVKALVGGFDFGKMYKAVSNVKSSEASEHMEQVMGSAVFSIPHSPEVASQVLAGNLFADLGLKDSRGYRKEIEKICKEVFGV